MHNKIKFEIGSVTIKLIDSDEIALRGSSNGVGARDDLFLLRLYSNTNFNVLMRSVCSKNIRLNPVLKNLR